MDRNSTTPAPVWMRAGVSWACVGVVVLLQIYRTFIRGEAFTLVYALLLGVMVVYAIVETVKAAMRAKKKPAESEKTEEKPDEIP